MMKAARKDDLISFSGGGGQANKIHTRPVHVMLYTYLVMTNHITDHFENIPEASKS
jgi:hypothetical protein